MSAALLLAAALTAWLGCSCVALSQDRHWKAVAGAAQVRRAKLRITGWLAMALSLGLAIARDGGSFAALGWPLLLAVGALATSAALTWKPSLIRPLAWILGARSSRKTSSAK